MIRLLMLAAACCSLTAQTPTQQLQSLLTHEIETKAPTDRWPDWSEDAFGAAETRDRASVEALRKIPRTKLPAEARTLYDLLERECTRRLDQFRLRMYLTPWFEDARFGPGPFNLAQMPRL